MNPILEALDASFSYPGSDHSALNGLNMQIPKGRKTAICGHNGSGKSTFFLQTVGIHKPSRGAIHWHGSPIAYRPNNLKELRQHIGLVFQDPEHQLILATPYEDISYGLRNAGMQEHDIQVRTKSMLATMNLAPLADTPIHHLSLGQKKRVALAGVMALEPELLLLDEPTAYLDRISEQKLIEELDRIHANGVTVVMATHDMNLAYAWADWILVMDQGQCVMEGTPLEIFEHKDQLVALGLELPLLLEVWQSLPQHMQIQSAPPRSLQQFQQLMQQFDSSVPTSAGHNQ
ncbi:energy-coupling factor ABC transporter ATP-binding protein [Paenibacillus sp. MMS18-CY102]|uniref:energy-coupling factor ABC transporter ATP-binding protein n=1 Tax=Paenibacillus sp. MMS18-CY102 TaxID=2682849 RepID=UPI00136658CB|nr:ABC transporter ATP-binding protein [Paenibacillus sp. MMS18-CY102]MWC30608.1 ATP-binding cassette domain-containing protein [Paenibacillus sp. MMS18-CY102]